MTISHRCSIKAARRTGIRRTDFIEAMPVWRRILSEQDAADLVAYLESLWSHRIVSCQGPKHMDCM